MRLFNGYYLTGNETAQAMDHCSTSFPGVATKQFIHELTIKMAFMAIRQRNS